MSSDNNPAHVPDPPSSQTVGGPPTVSLTNHAAGGVDGEVPTLAGYAIEAVVGRGGMGIVYRARHLALGRLVAVKLLAEGRGDVARFESEARAVARIQHPHIVQIFEVGQAGGQPYCVLEYVAGGSLAQRLKQGPLPPREAAALVETLARAMQAAHARGIVHRDLKPANILLEARDRSACLVPKIADFGLAKQLDDDSGQTQAGAILGTPSYMAPEQAGGDAGRAGPLADVYALGAVLYESLTGRPPFRGATVLETLEQVRSNDAQPPRSLNTRVPRDLDTIALKCLRKDPLDRYASADALAEDLRRFLNQEAIAARPAGPAERLVKWVKRRPLAAALAAALVLALGAGTAVSLHFAFEAGRRADDAEKNATKARIEAGRAADREAEAKALAIKLSDESKKAAAARDEVEKVLVERLSAPLERPDLAWENADFAALQDIVGLKSDRIRMRLCMAWIEKAGTKKELTLPGLLVVHAALGLHPERRTEAARHALPLVRDAKPLAGPLNTVARQLAWHDDELLLALVDQDLASAAKDRGFTMSGDLALRLAALSGREAEKRLAPVAIALLESMPPPGKYAWVGSWPRALSAIATRLPEAEARKLVARFLTLYESSAFDGRRTEPLAAALARLPGAEASTVARRLLQELTRRVDAAATVEDRIQRLVPLAQSLPLAALLLPEDASALGGAVIATLATDRNFGRSLEHLQLVTAVTEHLLPMVPDRERGDLALAAAHVLLPGQQGFRDRPQFQGAYANGYENALTAALAKAPAAQVRATLEEAIRGTAALSAPDAAGAKSREGAYFAETLRAHLKVLSDPDTARTIAAAALARLEQPGEPRANFVFLEALKLAAERLSAKDARDLVLTMFQTKGDWPVHYSDAYLRLSLRAPADEMAETDLKVAHALLDAIKKGKHAFPAFTQRTLGLLLDRLPPAEARDIAYQALKHGIERDRNWSATPILADLATALTPDQVEDLFRIGMNVVNVSAGVGSRHKAVLHYLSALQPLLPRERRAALIESAAARVLVVAGTRDAMEPALTLLAEWKKEIPESLLAPVARRQCAEMLADKTRKYPAQHFALEFSLLAELLPAKEKETQLRAMNARLMQMVFESGLKSSGPIPAKALFAKHLNQDGVLQLALRSQEAFLRAADNGEKTAAMHILSDALDHLDLPGLVEVLRAPPAGANSYALLRALERKTGRPFASTGEFITWAQTQAIDLRDPTRP